MPLDEAERLAALVSCNVLDTDAEACFDDIAQLASALCGTPMALVTLIDQSRQWFKAKVGLTASETPRDFAFCAHAIVDRQPLIVPDALADERFADNPLVTGEPFIRFYAGVPLLLDEDGAAVGTLCILDRVPRDLSHTQLDALRMLAKRASKELSLRRRLVAQLGLPSAQVSGGNPSSGEFTVPSQRPTAGEHLSSLARPTARLDAPRLAPLPVSIGTVVANRYQIERVLGVGGMGVVAAARELGKDTLVAIKFMHLDALAQPQALRRFVREAQALITLEGAHVARVFDVGNLASGAPFIVMEYLEGEDVAARLRREGRLAVRESVELTLQATDAIAAAHAQGILHRDLKPANLFLAKQPDGTTLLKVLDFGISKLSHPQPAQGDTALTGAATSLGSPHYMAPEQMIEAGDADERSDVWSLGVVLYELLAGGPPWEGVHAVEICAKVLTLPLPPIGERRPELRRPLVRVIERCLEKVPERRYGSAAALALDLRELLELHTGLA
jgi:serine/threonine-protein kinase